MDKIFANAERLADVLEADSEAQQGFLEFAVCFEELEKHTRSEYCVHARTEGVGGHP